MEKRDTKNKNKPSVFGERLAKIRRQNGLSQEELGKKIGLSQRVIAYYESETKYPPAGKLSQIAEIFNISTDELLGNKPLKSDLPDNKKLTKRMRILEKLSKRDQHAIFLFIDALANKRKIKV